MGKLSDALEKSGYGDAGFSQSAVDETMEINSFVEAEAPDDTFSGNDEGKEEINHINFIGSDKDLTTSEHGIGRQNKSEEQPARDTEKRQVLGRRSSGSGAWDERLFKAVNKDSFLPEVFNVLRSRILHPIDESPVPKTIMITSAVPREGKSFVAANLGVSLAQDVDQTSLLVDCDLRRPSLAALFGMKNKQGLVEYLRDGTAIEDLIRKTSVSKLSLIPSGKPPVNPNELLSSARMQALVEELSGRYEDRIIIFDSPPVQVASESIVLAGHVDAVILVVRQGVAGRLQVKKLVERLGADRILGVVFNGYTTNILERSLMKGYDGYYQQSYS